MLKFIFPGHPPSVPTKIYFLIFRFPLYSKGKEKLPFDYGVYLLNKNIAQLRWCCGLTTEDLRQTLQNLAALMTLDRKSHQ